MILKLKKTINDDKFIITVVTNVMVTITCAFCVGPEPKCRLALDLFFASPTFHKEVPRFTSSTHIIGGEDQKFCCNGIKGSLIFGIIMSIVSGFGLLVCIGLLLVMGLHTPHGFRCGVIDNETETEFDINELSFNEKIFYTIIRYNINVENWLLLFLLDFTFCAYLANGASKKKSSNVLTYFIYGVIKSTLGLIAGLLLILNNKKLPGAIVIVISALHSQMLLMVYKAYADLKLQKNYVQSDEEAGVQENHLRN